MAKAIAIAVVLAIAMHKSSSPSSLLSPPTTTFLERRNAWDVASKCRSNISWSQKGDNLKGIDITIS